MLFIILGSGIIVYSIINEPQPVIVGKDPLKKTFSKAEKEEVAMLIDVETKHSVKEKYITETNGNFKASISIPVLQIDEVNIEDINSKILEQYTLKYEGFKKEMADKVENKFTYKVTYKNHENIINGEKVISLTIYERMVDDNAKTNTMEQIETYNISLKTKGVITQELLASSIIGTNYANIIKEQVKQKVVVTSKMIAEKDYKYNITGLEKCYVKDGSFHIILNPGQVVDKKHGIIDLIIN